MKSYRCFRCYRLRLRLIPDVADLTDYVLGSFHPILQYDELMSKSNPYLAESDKYEGILFQGQDFIPRPRHVMDSYDHHWETPSYGLKVQLVGNILVDTSTILFLIKLNKSCEVY